MASAKFWENDPVVGQPAQPAQSGPRPVFTLPDPQGDAKERRDQAAAQRDEGRYGIDERSEVRQEGSSAIENAAKLRSAYDGLKPVQDYRNALPALMTALQTGPDATGDATLIYQWAKSMDPTGAVQQGDQDLAASGASGIQATVANLKKQFNIEGGGTFPPEVRERLRREIKQKVSEYARAYELQRQRFADDARYYGMDPARIIGPNDADAYRERYAELTKPAPTVNAPTDASTYGPNGVRFGMDGSDDAPFDAAAYLQERYGLTPGKQDRIIGMWNANLRNPNLTVDTVKQWYAQEGVDPPADPDIATAIQNAQRGVAFGGFDVAHAQKDYLATLDSTIAARGGDPESMSGAIGLNASQGVVLGGGDEIAGAGGFVRGLLTGEDPLAAYEAERDVLRRELDRSEQAHPVAAPLSQFAGGLISAPFGFRGVSSVADAAKAGAKVGAFTGFMQGEGTQDSLVGAGTGAAVGAALGAGGQKIGDALAARSASRVTNAVPSEGAEVLGAADRLNAQFGTDIRPIPADVAGPGIRNITGGAAKFPLAADPIVRAGERVTAEAEKAKEAIATLAGNATTGEQAAETALNGAKKFITTSKTKVDSLYAKARQLGGSEPVDLASARQVLDRNIAELEQTPGAAPGLAELKTLRADLDRPYPVDGVKAMRTTLRDRFLGDGLRGSDLERRVGQVVDAAEQDVVASLTAAGKGTAAAAYTAASKAHAERVDVIDNVLAPIIGKNGDKSVEDVIKALDTATKTKGARLGRFLAALPKADAGTVRASLINRLGMVSAGRQNADRTIFSLNDFLTHWNQLSDTAKSQMFGGELRVALNDLAKVAEGTKGAQQYGNFSNTGSPVGLTATLTAGSYGAVTHPFVTVGALVGQYAGGRLLASPAFARWLAKTPANPAAAAQHVKGLAKIAAADSVIAADALGLQRQLANAFSATPQRLAAQPNTETSTTGSENQ